MIQTFKKNFDNFTGEDIEKKKTSRKTKSVVANSPDERFKEIVSGSSLKNCPVEVKDVSNSYAILGANRNRLRGASTRQKPNRVKEEYTKITKNFYQLHNFFTLTADFMFINGIPLLVSFSRNIRLITREYVPTCTAGQLGKSLMRIVKLYARGGFLTHLVLMDMEFEKVKDKVGLLKVNTTEAGEHVAEIERKIRLLK